MEQNFEDPRARFAAKREELQSDDWAKDPSEYVLILSDVDDPQDLAAYEIFEVNTGWVIGWEDDEEQAEAVRRLLACKVPVMNNLP